MQDRKRKLGARSGAALLFAAAAASVLATAFAGSAAANVPGGQSCQSTASQTTNGQVAGGGATLQTRAQVAWIQGYTNDVCGFVGGSGSFGLNSNGGTTYASQANANSFLLYNGVNDNSQAINPINGSGAGLALLSCRMVPFAGSDTPYTTANLGNLDVAPGAQGGGNTWWVGNTPGTECHGAFGSGQPDANTWLNPFYGTNSNGTSAAYPFLGTSSQTADQGSVNVMSFPVTGTAVAVGIFFGTDSTAAANCPGSGYGTQAQLTKTQMDQLWGGNAKHWSDLGTGMGAGTGSDYSNCNLPVTRVVRSDGSGTSQNFKNYLLAIGRTTALCDGSSTWTTVAAANTNNWPQGANCSTVTPGWKSGNVGVLDSCTGSHLQPAVAGSTCYADLPDFQTYAAGGSAVPGFFTAELQNGANGAFVDPISGHHANCDFSVITTPASSPDGAVGLATQTDNSNNTVPDSWATNNFGGVHENVWNHGTGWPACATTFDLVYTNTSLANSGGPPANNANEPFRQLNNNMRRTLYSYILYVLTQGQTLTPSIAYASLPQGLLNLEVTGFQNNY